MMLGAGPAIRYAETADGVSLAFWMVGNGPPLLFTPPFPLGHFEMEWEHPGVGGFYRRLASSCTLVRYDPRGAGLSSREVDDYSLEARVADIEAVADEAGLSRFALFGFCHMGPPSIMYAARHPERVSRLILWYSYARYEDYVENPRVEAARSLIEHDWELYAELEGYRSTNWSGGEAARWYTEFLRRSVSPSGLSAAFRALKDADTVSLLPELTMPVLVLHRNHSDVLKPDVAAGLARAIPGARLAFVPGSAISPFSEESDSVLTEIEWFLADRPSRPAGLTDRELEVLRLLAGGRTNTQISSDLGLSLRTVTRHITHIYRKANVSSRSQATAFAVRHGVV